MRQAAPETFSPVQRVIWHSRPTVDKDGDTGTLVIPTPDQCDHSPVKLPSTRKFSAGGTWHHGKGRGGGYKKRKRGNAPQGGCQAGSPKQTAKAEEADAVGEQPTIPDDRQVVLGDGNSHGAGTGTSSDSLESREDVQASEVGPAIDKSAAHEATVELSECEPPR